MAGRIRTVFPDWFLNELADEQEKRDLLAGKIRGSELIHFKCLTCSLVYTQRIGHHITADDKPKQGCPECAKQKRADSHKSTSSKKRVVYPDWFIDELYNEEDKEKAKAGLLSTHTKVKFKCSCGEVYEQQITNHIKLSTGERKYGNCPDCSKKAIGEAYRKSIGSLKPYPQWFIDELYNDEDKEKAKVGNLSTGQYVDFCCPKCGNVYNQIISSHIKLSTGEKQKGCPKCGIAKQRESSRITRGVVKPYPQWFIDELYLEEDKEKAKSLNFLGDEEKQFYCKEHDVIYKSKISAIINLKTHERKRLGCPRCFADFVSKRFRVLNATKRKYPEWFINSLAYEEDKERARNGTLRSTKDVVTFKCEKGHLYKRVPYQNIRLSDNSEKYSCPICSAELFRSSSEVEIDEFIYSLGFYTEHPRFTSTLLNYFEIDIYIPEKHIGIEYNGSYYHKTLPNEHPCKDKLYHQTKFFACKELGIKLISIFDVDWMYKQDKIKQYLKDLLLNDKSRVYARKTEIKQISSNEANDMYDKYHLLGKTTVQFVSYGLFYNDELVSCMSFQKGRYKEDNNPVWCLTRFVTKSGLVVVGGASKLLKQFELEYKPSVLISFSDNDYFSGDVYRTLDFTYVGCTNLPRYFWVLGNKEIKREQCQLKKLSNKYPDLYVESLDVSGNKEDYIMLKLGAFKVYRSGYTKWIKRYI